MIQKICPVCDKAMGTSRYCRTCKRWVKYPYERDVTYRLNERHPAKEQDCTYHEAVPGVNWKPAGNASGPVRPAATAPPVKPGIPNIPITPAAPVRTARKSKGNGVSRLAGFLIFGYVIVRLIGGVSGIADVVNELTGIGAETDVYDAAMEEYEEEVIGQEITDEEAIAGGVACNGLEHFSVSGEEAKAQLLSWVSERGYEPVEKSTSSYNEKYQDGTTFYATWDYVGLMKSQAESEESLYSYFEVSIDTVTGEVHQVEFSMPDLNLMGEGLVIIAAILDDEAIQNAELYHTIRSELESAMLARSSYLYETESMWIEGDMYDGSYYIVLSSPVVYE